MSTRSTTTALKASTLLRRSGSCRAACLAPAATALLVPAFLVPALLVPALLVFALPAFAGEADYCVTCTGPSQTYRCRVTGDGVKPSDVLKLYCVVRVTKDEHHASCSARVADGCHGIDKAYSFNSGAILDSLATDPHVKKFKNKVQQENGKFAEPDQDKKGPPKSLMDWGGRMMGNAKARMGNGEQTETTEGSAPPPPAGAAAPAASPPARPAESATAEEQPSGSFASRSYHCLRSFFRHCGSAADGSSN